MAGGERTNFNNPVVNWIDERLPVFTLMKKEYGTFPTPKNFNYFWNFGAIATVFLALMILTGIVLAMHYTPNAALAFGSVERIMRDVNWGWMLRYLHMNGASFFFAAVYIHIFRGMYYGSFKKPRELLWILGVVIFLLMMATAFMGYTLPWSQMGGWAATVITNLFSAIPLVGQSLVNLLWGGFSVDNPTLNRFFSLHYLLPFVIFGVVGLHVWALHIGGSNNPSGVDPKGPQDTLPFHPFYTAKDTFGLCVFLLIYVAVSFFAPNMFAHPDHFVEFNPMQTPSHIVPEWYFLPFYAILRAITFDTNLVMLGGIGIMFLPFFLCCARCVISWLPQVKSNPAFFPVGVVVFALGLMLSGMIPVLTGTTIIAAKFGGVLSMFGSVILLFFLPWLDSHPVRSARYRPLYKMFLLLLVADFIMLGYIGMETADAVKFGIPLIYVGQVCTAYYFLYFLVILPWLSRNEKALPVPKSINEAVLQEKNPKAHVTPEASR